MRQVPLWGRVIFSDWHGVLSQDPFWVSIRGSAAHPLHAQLEAGVARVFASERPARNFHDAKRRFAAHALRSPRPEPGNCISPDRRAGCAGRP